MKSAMKHFLYLKILWKQINISKIQIAANGIDVVLKWRRLDFRYHRYACM